ncbi:MULTISPECIES: class I SAM-dependent methyltransferase [unclassified Roseitalea]|uniref:class I SAM-dependent methyltransferase n=1 Tax=unclassified Roseitalea TaxID=2639107 RepID=UPI00273FD305|nr:MULTISPECIES: class I SAM-dependent methyltransferase [unclassified Roseitalea]
MDRLVYERMDEQEAVHWWFAARRDLIGATIERLIRLPDRPAILEAGCGTGGNLRMLASLGDLDAFEYDEAARAIAETKADVAVGHGALPDVIPFAPKRYDLIGLFDVLEHIEDDRATLNRLGERLAPDGRLFVTVPALPWLWSAHDERHHHFRRYTRRSLRRTAQEAGLAVQDCFYFNSLLLPVAVAMRAVKAALRSDSPDDTLPANWLNGALYRVFASERHLVGRLPMPVGLSVCAILAPGPSR